MKQMFSILIVVALFDYALTITSKTQKAQINNSVQEAKNLWELAVNAKGGRQKLEQVNSLAVFYKYSKRHDNTELYVFPDKRWDWFDTGPSSKFPLHVSAMDFDKKVYCFVQRYTGEGCSSIGTFSKRAYLEDPQLLYLLESKWVKPELLAASKSTLGFRSVNVVKIQLEIFQISVYLDAKTHLPLRIAYHVDEGGRKLKAGDIFQWYGLSDYRNVDGLMMPHQISHTESPTRQIRYEINPTYDESIFNRKPDLSAGPEQWRPKGYQSGKSE